MLHFLSKNKIIDLALHSIRVYLISILVTISQMHKYGLSFEEEVFRSNDNCKWLISLENMFRHSM